MDDGARIPPHRGSDAERAARARAIGCGLGTAVLGGAVLFGGCALAFTIVEASAEQARAVGQISGYVAVVLLVGAAAAGSAWRRTPWLGAVISIGVIALCAVPGLLPVLGHLASAHRALTSEERVPPHVANIVGEERLVQPALGFDMLAPRRLVLDPDASALASGSVEELQRHGMDGVAWVWASPEDGRALIVIVSLSARSSHADDDREMFDTMVESSVAELAQQGFTLEIDDRRGPFDHVAYAGSANGARVMMRSFRYSHGDSRVTVSVSAIGTDISTLVRVVDSARATP